MALVETLGKRGVFASPRQRLNVLKRYWRLRKISAQYFASCSRLRPRKARAQAAQFTPLPIIGRSALLSLAAMLASVSPSSAGSIDVADQAGFNAAIQAAITTGQPNTINVTTSTLITADTGLVLPGQASPLNLNFVGSAPSFGVGSGSTGSLTIGANTNITFTPTSSAALFRVGYGAGSSGTVTMTGGTITGNQSASTYLSFSMGRNFGTGTFNQSGGTFSLNGGAFQVGVASGQGTYNLSGTGAVNMGALGTIYLGDAAGGVGILNVSGSASFSSGIQAYVGNGAGSQGTITQNGPGSQVVLNGRNYFGTNVDVPAGPGGTGTYNLVSGSLEITNAAFAIFGNVAGASGILNQSGGILTTDGTGRVYIGQSGAGQYNMSGGTATLANGLMIGQFAGSTGIVNQTGGTLTLSGGQIRFGAGAGTYNLNGGLLQAGGTNGITGTGSLNLGGGALQVIGSALTTNIAIGLTGTASTVDTNGLGATFGGVMSGGGGFTKIGAGTLTLSGVNTYTGATLVNAGTLQAGAAGGFASTSAFTVASGATLDLNGFNQTIGSLAGGGTVNVGTAFFIAGGNNTDTAFSGTINLTNQSYTNPFGQFAKVGSGTLTIDNATIALGEAYIVQGAMAQTSGTTTVTDLAVGEQPGSVARLNVSGGTISFGTGLQVGDFGGQGTVNQTGGTVVVTPTCGDTSHCASLIIGNQGGSGTYNISGGELDLTGLLNTLGRTSGTGNPGSTGTLNISGGVVDLSGANSKIVIGYGNADPSTAQSQGMITQTGGVLRVHNGSFLFLAGQNTSPGVYNLNGGTLAIGGTSLQAGYMNASPNYQFNLGGGTIQVIEAALVASVNSTLMTGSTSTIDTNGFNATWNGALTGGGGLAKIGAGTFTLHGVGNYSGATAVNAGTFQAGAANVFSPVSAYTIANGATLNLAGFNNTIGSLAGAGTVALGSATLTGGGDGTSTTFSGAIGGTGGLVKTGGGTLALTGASNYTGPTNINGGTLDVNGSLASAVFVNAGGSLMGSGTIGGLNVASGGTVAPGNSIGTLHIAGNVGFATGSAYQVEVNAAGQSDLIAASGHATLTGGTVQVLGTPAANLTYTILTAQGGVSGTFSGASSNFVFLSPELNYTPTSVLLSLVQTRAFASAAATPNEFNVAVALNSLQPGTPLYQAVLMQTSAAGAQQAYNALSGEIHASAQAVMIDDAHYARQAMLGRMRQAGYDTAAGPLSALGSGGPDVAYAASAAAFTAHADPAAAPLAYADTRGSAPLLPGVLPLALPAPDTAWWAQGVGAWGRINGDSNVAGVSRDLAGFFTGVDRRFGENWRAGIAGGYTNSSVSDSGRASSANIDTTHIGVYALGNYGAWNFRGGTAASFSTVGTDRAIFFPGFGDTASAHYGAAAVQVFSELGYGMAFGAIAAEPFAGLAWVHLQTNPFVETDLSTAGLNGSGSQTDVGYSTLGARLATNYVLPNGMVLTPRASAAWQHAFGDVRPDAVLAFEGGVSQFTVAGAPLARDAALVEAGLDLRVTPLATVGISYTGQLAQGIQDHSVKGSLLIKF